MEAEDAEDDDEGILNYRFCGFQNYFFIVTEYVLSSWRMHWN